MLHGFHSRCQKRETGYTAADRWIRRLSRCVQALLRWLLGFVRCYDKGCHFRETADGSAASEGPRMRSTGGGQRFSERQTGTIVPTVQAPEVVVLWVSYQNRKMCMRLQGWQRDRSQISYLHTRPNDPNGKSTGVLFHVFFFMNLILVAISLLIYYRLKWPLRCSPIGSHRIP